MISFLTRSFAARDIVPPLAFLALMLLGLMFPLRRVRRSVAARVLKNLLVAAPALLLFKLALLPFPIAAGAWAARHGFGLLNLLALPAWARLGVGVVLFDWAYYFWHRGVHVVPFLWRFHAVHHLDAEMDASTAARFHWGELLLSVPFRVLVVALLGLNTATILTYELMFEVAALFHHSNWRLPARLEAGLSRALVTPRLHGIHHGDQWTQTNSNWGTVFSCWDALHRTFRLDVPQRELRIGTPDEGTDDGLTPLQLWTLPFKRR